jgi:lipopolysaccharide transport system ATP-binding protein
VSRHIFVTHDAFPQSQMAVVAIAATRLGKKYTLGSGPADGAPYRTLRESLTEGAVNLFRSGKRNEAKREFWALRNVDFEIQQGEVIGIIGRNGAGKSTLLKILSRITEPTTGTVRINGRVASLLEVGTGFHQELTGRENVFLNGAILGMSRAEIKSKFDQIVEFADVSRFLDTPVKRYSSGMYVRLAFAVAAHLEPEILVVDEVLAVGDAEFQRKCLGKMHEVSRQGRTVLFVSHNMGAITSLCSSCIWLDRGEISLRASPRSAISAYLRHEGNGFAQRQWDSESAPGDADFKLRAVRVCQPCQTVTRSIDITKPFEIEIESDVLAPAKNVKLGFQIVNSTGDVAIHTSEVMLDPAQKQTSSGRRIYVCRLPAYALNSDDYFLNISADEPNVRVLFVKESVLNWTVESTCERMSTYEAAAWKGITGPGLVEWTVRNL